MRLKKFEELDWSFFNKKTPIEINKKKLINICDFLSDDIGSAKIEGIKPRKIEIGLSKTHKNKFIISILYDNDNYIRYNYHIDDNFLITKFINYILVEDGRIKINSLNTKVKCKDLSIYKIKIDNYFKSNNLFIS